jgi:predicted DNA-binding protein
MEVHFSPETERQLKDLAGLTGRAPGDLVQDVVAAYVEELAQVRATLDSRYDDLLHGRVEAVSAEDAAARFERKSRARTAATRP